MSFDAFAELLPFPAADLADGDPDVLEVVPGLAETLAALGYLPWAPAHVAAEALAVDAEAAAAMPCTLCGRAGLTFAPYHRGRSYRGVLACPYCGTEQEI